MTSAAPEPGKQIVSIEFSGNEVLGAEALKGRLRLKEGAAYEERGIDAAVRDLYTIGIAQVRVEAADTAQGVRVIFHVVENLVVDTIRHKGCPEKIWRGILEETGLRRGSLLFRTDLEEIKNRIRQDLVERGYWKPSIGEGLLPNERGVAVEIQVQTGPKAHIASVKYEGNEHIKQGKIKKGAPVDTRKRFFFFFGGDFDPAKWEADLAKIERFYRNEGWLDARVSEKREITPDEKKIRLTAVLSEGDRYPLRSFVVRQEGHPIDEAALLEKVKSKVGEPYVPRQIEEDIDKIRTVFWNEGYFGVHVEKEASFDFDKKQVDMTVRAVSGEKVYLRDLRFQGNLTTRDKVLRREFGAVPGDPLRWGEIREGAERLRNLFFFKPGSIHPRDQETGNPSTRDVLVELEEDKTGMFNVGGGISSDNSIFADITFRQRNFDLARWQEFPLSRGGGQDFSLSLKPGTRISQYQLSFYEPWLMDRPVGFRFQLSFLQRLYRLYIEERQGGSITLSRRFARTFTVGTTFKKERIEIRDVDLDAPASVQQARGTTDLNSVTPYFIWDRRDNAYVPSRGTSLNGSWEIAGGKLGGVDFNRVLLDWDGHLTAYEDRDERKHILSADVRTGWVEAYGGTAEVPIFERFFAGGASTIRGFNFRSVSPRENGESVGGNFRFLTSLEYSFPLFSEQEYLRGAVFYDRGTVERRITGDITDEFRSSYGFGLRLRIPHLSPLPIRMDFGFPLEKERDDSLQMFSFTLSGMF